MKVKEGIISIKTFQGLAENIEINKFGDAKRGLSIFIVENGEFKTWDGLK
jgi:hypothetical protein